MLISSYVNWLRGWSLTAVRDLDHGCRARGVLGRPWCRAHTGVGLRIVFQKGEGKVDFKIGYGALDYN